MPNLKCSQIQKQLQRKNFKMNPSPESIHLKSLYADYLFHSYLYYKKHTPVLTDEAFDAICKELLAKWGEVEHRFKYLTTKEDLEAGTGYAIAYPNGMIAAFEVMCSPM